MTVRSSWLAITGQSREDTRLTQLGATLPADSLKVRSGILPGTADGTAGLGGFKLDKGSGMSATVEPGRAVIQGMTTQGAYPVTLSEPAVVTFADGDSQSRVDLLCVQVSDDSYDGLGATQADLVIVRGTPGSTTAPPLPPAALPLYSVKVPAAASAGTGGIDWAGGITDLRTSTVAAGGVLPVYGNSAVPGAYVSQLRDSGTVLQRWDGTSWVPYPASIGGIAPASTSTGGYIGQYRDTTAGYLQRWTGSAWAAPIPGPAFVSSGDAGYCTTTGYLPTLFDTPANSTLKLTFTPPPSRSVLVTLGAAIYTETDPNARGFMAAKLVQGSVLQSDVSDDRSASGCGTGLSSVVTTYQVTGLTAGTPCTVTAYFRCSVAGKSCWFDNRFIRIDPVP